MSYLRLGGGLVALLVCWAAYQYLWVAPRAALADSRVQVQQLTSELAELRESQAADAVACGLWQAQATSCASQLDDLVTSCSVTSAAADAGAVQELEGLRRRQAEVLSREGHGPARMNRAFRELAL